MNTDRLKQIFTKLKMIASVQVEKLSLPGTD